MHPDSIPINTVPFLKEVECDHVHWEYRTQRSYGSTYTWKVCMTCGYEWNYHCQDGW